MDLRGRNILITGAARRLGRAIAEALAARGANIAIHCRASLPEGCRLAKKLGREFGIKAVAFKADLSVFSEIPALSRRVLNHFRTIDVLINSASIYEKNKFGRTSERDWDRHLNVNLKAPFFLSQAMAGPMKKTGGKIINIADWSGIKPYVDYIPYCVSKAGLICLNTALAKALAPKIQVNAILPGPVLLPEGLSAGEARTIAEATLVKRLGSPRDIVKAIIFLLEDGDFITGTAIPVDGGRLIA
ncbi:MAG: SDR family NAD(P)-dependent oxidoreductase [Elusimicrobiota bacterium]